MQLTFFDTELSWQQMLPLSYTRPVSDLRVGIMKIHEKWSRHLQASTVSYRGPAYLAPCYPRPTQKSLHIQGGTLPDASFVGAVQSLKEGQVLVSEGELVAGYFEPDQPIDAANQKAIEINPVVKVQHPWDLFALNGQQIKQDFRHLTQHRSTQPLHDPHTVTYGHEVFLEEGAQVKAAVLNATNGPIYIGRNAEVQEGSLIRGPFALGDHSVVNMGAKIREQCTIGPFSKVGGELSNVVIQGYSNKGHDGFLGNAVIGSWCNLGADTNNSNLKNNYTKVKMWDFGSQRFKDTGLQFCGLVMGDHAKCGINTMFNTGTTVGVSANIFGEGFPRTIIPSFAWGGAAGFSTYAINKALDTAKIVMERRKKSLSQAEIEVLSHIFEMTAPYRVWEKK